jgi:hypothetical protein
MPVIETEIKTGESWQIGDLELTPMTRVLKVKVPGYHAGLVWNRPKAVVVRTADGEEQVIPVTDFTRIAIWAMLAGGLLGAIMMGLFYQKR